MGREGRAAVRNFFLVTVLLASLGARISAADMDFCLKTAVLNNPRLVLSAEDIKIARLKRNQVSSLFMPKLSLGAYYDYYSLDYPSVFSSSIGAFNLQEASDNFYGTRMTLTQPLYTGGAITTLKKQASQTLLDSENIHAAEKNRVLYGVKVKYINVLYIKKKLEALENAMRQVRKIDDGAAAESYAEMLSRKAALDASLVDNIYDLNALTASEFIAGEDITGDAFIDESLSGDAATKFTLLAIANRPELKSLREKESVDFLSLGLEQSVKFPNVDLFSTYDYLHAAENEWATNFQVGVSMTLPLYDGGARWLRFEEKKALLRKTKVSIAQTEEAIKREVEKACRKYSLAEKYLSEAAASKKSFRMPQRAGSGDIMSWARVTENELDAEMRFYLAGAYLEYAVGILISKY